MMSISGQIGVQTPSVLSTTALLRREDLPVIDLTTGAEVRKAIEATGYNPDDVFLKCVRGLFHRGSRDKFEADIKKSCRRLHLSPLPIHPIDEVDQLVRIYNVNPANTVRPMAMARLEGRKPDIAGYFMEFVGGNPLHRLFRGRQNGAVGRAFESFLGVVGNLHSNGVGHGDLKYKHVIVTPSSSIVLIDPFPCCGFLLGQNGLIERDRMTLEVLERGVRDYFDRRNGLLRSR